MDIKKCVEYMKQKHYGQKRKHGDDYYTHPLAVSKILMEKGFGEDYVIAGIFHDLIEDTNATYDEILELSNPIVTEAVRLVTKEKGYDIKDYFERISNNEVAKMVKLADRVHNLSESVYTSEKFRRKYVKETEEYFIDLAKGTPFEEDIARELERIKETLEIER